MALGLALSLVLRLALGPTRVEFVDRDLLAPQRVALELALQKQEPRFG
jgi:hypothetical protein